MRILFLALDIDLSHNRGDAVHVRNLAKTFANSGHEVHLVVAANPDMASRTGLGISVRPAGGDAMVLGHVLHAAKGIRAQVIYERRASPKISAAAASLMSVPYVVEINGLPEDEIPMQGRSLGRGPGSRVKRFARLRLLRAASAVVTVTPGLRAALASRYKIDVSKIHVVPNGVDPEQFRPADRGAARTVLTLPENPIAVFVGNIVQWQGLHTLVDALVSTPEDLTILVVGDGPDRDEIIDRATRIGVRHRLQFVGAVAHKRVPQYLAAANACVAPFSSERNLARGVSALKVYEYLASARPVVVSAVPGAAELVEEFGCGLVVPPGDAHALSEALVRVVSDPAFAEAALRASEFVRDGFSWERTAERLSLVLEGAVGK